MNKPEKRSGRGSRRNRPAEKQGHPSTSSDGSNVFEEEENSLSEVDQFMETYGTAALADAASSASGSTKTNAPQHPRIRRNPGDLTSVGTGMLIQGGIAVAATVIWLAMLIMATQGMISFDTLSNSGPLLLLAALVFVAGESMGITVPKATRSQLLCIAGVVCTVLAAICSGINYLAPADGTALRTTLRTVLSVICFAMLMVRFIVTAAFLVRISRYADLKKYETQATFAMVGKPFALTAVILYVLYAPQVTEDMSSALRLATRGIQIWIVVTVVSVAVMYVSTLIGMGRILRREQP